MSLLGQYFWTHSCRDGGLMAPNAHFGFFFFFWFFQVVKPRYRSVSVGEQWLQQNRLQPMSASPSRTHCSFRWGTLCSLVFFVRWFISFFSRSSSLIASPFRFACAERAAGRPRNVAKCTEWSARTSGAPPAAGRKPVSASPTKASECETKT